MSGKQADRERVETGLIGRRMVAKDPEDRQYVAPTLDRADRATTRILPAGQDPYVGTKSSWPQPVDAAGVAEPDVHSIQRSSFIAYYSESHNGARDAQAQSPTDRHHYNFRQPPKSDTQPLRPLLAVSRSSRRVTGSERRSSRAE